MSKVLRCHFLTDRFWALKEEIHNAKCILFIMVHTYTHFNTKSHNYWSIIYRRTWGKSRAGFSKRGSWRLLLFSRPFLFGEVLLRVTLQKHHSVNCNAFFLILNSIYYLTCIEKLDKLTAFCTTTTNGFTQNQKITFQNAGPHISGGSVCLKQCVHSKSVAG